MGYREQQQLSQCLGNCSNTTVAQHSLLRVPGDSLNPGAPVVPKEQMSIALRDLPFQIVLQTQSQGQIQTLVFYE